MERYRGKYRTGSNRLFGWDYSSNGLYSITSVTAGRSCYFGEILNGQMIYNEFGKIQKNGRTTRLMEWLGALIRYLVCY